MCKMSKHKGVRVLCFIWRLCERPVTYYLRKSVISQHCPLWLLFSHCCWKHKHLLDQSGVSLSCQSWRLFSSSSNEFKLMRNTRTNIRERRTHLYKHLFIIYFLVWSHLLTWWGEAATRGQSRCFGFNIWSHHVIVSHLYSQSVVLTVWVLRSQCWGQTEVKRAPNLGRCLGNRPQRPVVGVKTRELCCFKHDLFWCFVFLSLLWWTCDVNVQDAADDMMKIRIQTQRWIFFCIFFFLHLTFGASNTCDLTARARRRGAAGSNTDD